MPYPIVSFFYNTNKELWWCNAHQRKATYMRQRVFELKKGRGDIESLRVEVLPCCDPRLGGITLECSCVNLTGVVEIEE